MAKVIHVDFASRRVVRRDAIVAVLDAVAELSPTERVMLADALEQQRIDASAPSPEAA